MENGDKLEKETKTNHEKAKFITFASTNGNSWSAKNGSICSKFPNLQNK
jgi:hypothetical protein